MSEKTIVTMTVTGVPVSLNGVLTLVDCVVTVDFAQIAVERACNAAYSTRKKSTAMGGAIIVQATNQRPRPA